MSARMINKNINLKISGQKENFKAVSSIEEVFIAILGNKDTLDKLKAALRKIKNYISKDNVLLCGDFHANLSSSDTRDIIEQHNLKLLSPR